MARIDNLTNFLTDVATAIKGKTGKNDAITPANFDTEIASIETGGGDTSIEDGLVTRTLTEYSNDRVSQIGDYSFYHMNTLKSVVFKNATKIGENCFKSCTALTTVNVPNLKGRINDYNFNGCTSLSELIIGDVTQIGRFCFSECSSLTSLDFPKVTTIDMQSFAKCRSVTTVNFPELTEINYGYNFMECTSLQKAVFPKVSSITGSGNFQKCSSLTEIEFDSNMSITSIMFSNCTALTKVILKSDRVCSLSNSNSFSSTPIASGTGFIYVPDNLVDSYKSATNWSTFANQIKPISELEASA